jgi:hypothetical protein
MSGDVRIRKALLWMWPPSKHFFVQTTYSSYDGSDKTTQKVISLTNFNAHFFFQ